MSKAPVNIILSRPKPFIILNAGIRRSGSVWQYNVIRIALQESGYSVHGGFPGSSRVPYNPKDKSDVHLVKSHDFNIRLANRAGLIFTSFRSIWEIRDSMIRRANLGGNNPNKTKWKQFDQVLIHFAKWQQMADHCTYHEDLKSSALFEVVGILMHLKKHFKIIVTSESVLERVSALKPPTTGTDPVTMMVTNHFTSR